MVKFDCYLCGDRDNTCYLGDDIVTTTLICRRCNILLFNATHPSRAFWGANDSWYYTPLGANVYHDFLKNLQRLEEAT